MGQECFQIIAPNFLFLLLEVGRFKSLSSHASLAPIAIALVREPPASVFVAGMVLLIPLGGDGRRARMAGATIMVECDSVIKNDGDCEIAR